MNQPDITIHWFRQDLRLSDNAALCAAARKGVLLPIYIVDPDNNPLQVSGRAHSWWLHNSLQRLNQQLQGRLQVFSGDALTIFAQLIKKYPVKEVYFNRCFEAWRVQQDSKISALLHTNDVASHRYNGSLLWQPEQLRKQDGSAYQVFSPFFRNAKQNALEPHPPLAAPQRLNLFTTQIAESLNIEQLGLLGGKNWSDKFHKNWQVGEQAAQQRLQHFIAHGLTNYRHGRDYPSKNNVSRLSAALHFGELSPQQLWHAALNSNANTEDIQHWHNELGWREFAHTLQQVHPDLGQININHKFDHFGWRNDEEKLHCWQRGLTGYPLVDAGMRELWQTGYMHNRLRMIVGSFLVKNLLLHWHHGRQWFEECLVDADPAINSSSWQWVAGCGADAAPFFRIFNPVVQGQKFDPDGSYTRHYVPELKMVPQKYLFNPWQAPPQVLLDSKVKLGENYPMPIVDLKASRQRALEAYQRIKNR